MRSASYGSIHSITIENDTPISNDDKGILQQQPTTNIELSRYYVVNNIYLPKRINNGDNKFCNMYHEGQAHNEIGCERIYTHLQSSSSHYVCGPLPGTKNLQTEHFDEKNDLFEESGFPNNPHKLSRFDTRDFHGYQAQILPGITVPKTGHENRKYMARSSTPISESLHDSRSRRNTYRDKGPVVHSGSVPKLEYPSVFESNNWHTIEKETSTSHSKKNINLIHANIFKYDHTINEKMTMRQSSSLTKKHESKAQRTKLPDMTCTTSPTSTSPSVYSFVNCKDKENRMILARHPAIHDEPNAKHSISQLCPSINSKPINYRPISFIDLTGPIHSNFSSNHQSQQLYPSDPESLEPAANGKYPKREHVVDLTLDSSTQQEPFKRSRVTDSRQSGSARSHSGNNATCGSHNQKLISPELKHWMSFNPIQHIVLCSKDSRDISDRIYDKSSAIPSISDDITALLNIKIDNTNIHSVHLKDHQADSPIPSLGNTNNMHGYSSKSALKFVSTIRSAAIGDTILLVSLGIQGISNSPRAWVDLRENYPAYKFLVAIQELGNINSDRDFLWRITKKRTYLIFPLYELVRVCLGLESPCDEAKLYSEYMTLSNDARKALRKTETRVGSGNNVSQHA